MRTGTGKETGSEPVQVINEGAKGQADGQGAQCAAVHRATRGPHDLAAEQQQIDRQGVTKELQK